MIPTVILAGLVAALAVGFRLRALVAVGVFVALLWGLLVTSEGAFVGGTMLAIPNYVVGALTGLSVRHVAATAATTTGLVRRRRAG